MIYLFTLYSVFDKQKFIKFIIISSFLILGFLKNLVYAILPYPKIMQIFYCIIFKEFFQIFPFMFRFLIQLEVIWGHCEKGV